MKRFLFTIMAFFLFSAFSQAQDRIALVGSSDMIDSQSLTTTIFKRFVVYIEDLRRGFATG